MKFYLNLLRYSIVLLISAGILYGAWQGYRRLASLRKLPMRRDSQKVAPLVRVCTITANDVRLDLEGYGRVRAIRSVVLTPQVKGPVIKVHAHLKAGDFVASGALLVQIDPTDYQLALEQAQAQLATAQARLRRLEQELRNVQRQIKVVGESQSLALEIMQRSIRLFERRAVSETERDRDHQTYLDVTNRLVQLENTARLLPCQIKEAQAAVQSAQTACRQAQVNLKRTKIRAPFAARVQSANVEVGTVVNTNSRLAVLEDRQAAEIPVMIPARQLEFLFARPENMGARLLKGLHLPATVSYRSVRQTYEWQGEVVRFEPLVSQDMTVPVIVVVTDPWQSAQRPPLQNGQFVHVTIQGRKLRHAVSIPRAALQINNQVYLVRHGRLQIKPVQVLLARRDHYIITQGVQSGDVVVLSTLPVAIPNMALRTTTGGQP